MIGLAAYFSGAHDRSAPFGLALPSAQPLKFAPSMFASDRDWGDFKTRWEAQSFFSQAGPGDPHRLDDDGDGLVCEFNPWFDLSAWFGR
jgi:micrococcal nuclease